MTARKITQDVRDYAAKMNEAADAAQAGIAEMSKKFREMGEQVYVEGEEKQ